MDAAFAIDFAFSLHFYEDFMYSSVRDQIKTEERAQKAQHSALDDIPRSLPALMRAQKIQKRCANVGFE